MQKPNFSDLKKLINAIADVDDALDWMFLDSQDQTDSIMLICRQIAAESAQNALNEVSVNELKNAKAGIRVAALEEAGYTNLGQLSKLTDYQLMSVEGIGEKQTEAIRNLITDFANSLSSRVSVRLEAVRDGDETSRNAVLITEMARFISAERIREEAKEPAGYLKEYRKGIENDRFITNGFRWLFSGNELKQYTVQKFDEIYGYCNSRFFQRIMELIQRYDVAIRMTPGEASRIFERNSADFYALLESLGSGIGHKPFVYDSIPAQLAEDINNEALDLSSFTGNLRAYQLFGAKYVIHQKYVLLGDEMGLGKTVQAIAAMAHIRAVEGNGCHFLVVCPASVLVNWAREIKKFSGIETYILHGAMLEAGFEAWNEKGGAAITNYESMGKIVDRIDNHMTISMLVIDEAHYIKNPDAQRTKHIHRLDNESQRIVMMTGTPLENRVEEMCNLIQFVRPDMVQDIKTKAHISHLLEFKETLAPVYLRRTRKQVLTELPPIDEKQEWCDMTDSDRLFYIEAVASANFSNMRRVSFLQDNLAQSSKAVRMMELISEAGDEGRKVVVFSFFRDTLFKTAAALGDRCIGLINGDTPIEQRQVLIDRFNDAPDGSVLVCQIQAGGVGLNIQSASIVIFCEPQIKPSLTWQALSRVYRMGQIRNVLVYHLLCPGTVDDEMMRILEAKEVEFNNFANESAASDAYDNIMDKDWINRIIEAENMKLQQGTDSGNNA
jgi:superfamily II DNA or RNA helicase